MANQDISITQEQADGSLKKITLPPAARALLAAVDAAAQREAMGIVSSVGSVITVANLAQRFALSSAKVGDIVIQNAGTYAPSNLYFLVVDDTALSEQKGYKYLGAWDAVPEIDWEAAAPMPEIIVDATIPNLYNDGTPLVGMTLHTTLGGWTNSPVEYLYQWKQDVEGGYTMVDIPSETGPDFTIPEGTPAGTRIACGIRAANLVGPSAENIVYCSNTVGDGAVALSDELVASYHLGESTGDRVDALGLSNLTPVNDPSNGTGLIGSALVLDGTQSLIGTLQVSAFSSFSTGSAARTVSSQFSVSAWFKQASYISGYDPATVFGPWANYSPIAVVNTGMQPAWFALCLSGNNVPQFAILSATPFGALVSTVALSTTTPALGVWHNLIGVCRKGVLEIWLDGVLDTTLEFAGVAKTVPYPLLEIGANAGQGSWSWPVSGIDEVCIWERPLNQTEILAVYNGRSGVSLP